MAGSALGRLSPRGQGLLRLGAGGAGRSARVGGAHELGVGAHAEAGDPLGGAVELGGRLAGHLGHLREQLAHALGGALQLRPRGLAAIRQPVLDAREAIGAEEPFEHGLPLAAVGAQESRELALRQQHDLAELVARHAEQVVQFVLRLVRSRGEREPLAGRGIELLHGAGVALSRQPLAAQLRALLRRAAHDPQPPLAQRHLQLDLGARPGVRMVAAQPRIPRSRARHLAIQSERHGVQERRLAGAGVAVQQEEAGLAERVEVDLLAAGERLEGGEAQAVEPHGAGACAQAASSATRRAVSASRSSASSSSSASRPRVSATKRCTSSSSSNPRRRW